MKFFCQFIQALEGTGDSAIQCAHLKEYLSKVGDTDKLWTLALIVNRGPKKLIEKEELKHWAIQHAKIDSWLFEDSLNVTMDFVETCGLILPLPSQPKKVSLTNVIEELISLQFQDFKAKEIKVKAMWDELPIEQKHVYCQLLVGTLKVMKPSPSVFNTLAEVIGGKPEIWAYKLSNSFNPTKSTIQSILTDPCLVKPLPFSAFTEIVSEASLKVQRSSLCIQSSIRGLRVQLISYEDQLHIWSEKGEFITDSFQELKTLEGILPPNIIIDGQLVVVKESRVQSAAEVHDRIGRKVTRKRLLNAHAVLYCYDLLESERKYLTAEPLKERIDQLNTLFQTHILAPFLVMPPILETGFDELQLKMMGENEKFLNGYVVRSWNDVYHEAKNYIWRKELPPINLILTYAKKSNNIFSNFTFSIWKNGALLPLVNTQINLANAEMDVIVEFVENNILEKFGTTYMITPTLVFEIKFKGMSSAKRKKAGVSLIEPLVIGVKNNVLPEEASQLKDLQNLLPDSH